MRITKAVKATIAANDAYGWHLFYGDRYNGFETKTAQVLVEMAKHQGWTLASVTGNGLAFTKGN